MAPVDHDVSVETFLLDDERTDMTGCRGHLTNGQEREPVIVRIVARAEVGVAGTA